MTNERIFKHDYITMVLFPGVRTKIENTAYGDTKTIVFSGKSKDYNIGVQVWSRTGSALKYQYDGFRSAIKKAVGQPANFQSRPGLLCNPVNFMTTGLYSRWDGGGKTTETYNGVFTDFEVMSDSDATVVYVRFFVKAPEDLVRKQLEAFCGSIVVASPEMW